MSNTSKNLEKPAGMNPTPAPLVIGIGASAGGLEALQQFFSCMPPACARLSCHEM